MMSGRARPSSAPPRRAQYSPESVTSGRRQRPASAAPRGRSERHPQHLQPLPLETVEFMHKEYPVGQVLSGSGPVTGYYFLKSTPLTHYISRGLIKWDTKFLLVVEHCTAERPTATLRGSTEAYTSALDKLQEEVMLMSASQWNVEIEVNPRRVLHPVGKGKKYTRMVPRIGSFEITLEWQCNGTHSVLLYSKLFCRRWPVASDLVKSLLGTLEAVRVMPIAVSVRDAATLEPVRKARLALVADEEPVGDGEGEDGVLLLDSSAKSWYSDKSGLVVEQQMVWGPLPDRTVRLTVEHSDYTEREAVMAVHGGASNIQTILLAPKQDTVGALEASDVVVVLHWGGFRDEGTVGLSADSFALMIRTPSGLVLEESLPVSQDGILRPISLQLPPRQDGEYHVYVKRLQPSQFSWSKSTVTVSVLNNQGFVTQLVCESDDTQDWWDVVVLQYVDGSVEGVSEHLNTCTLQPGFAEWKCRVVDIDGKPQAGSNVVVEAVYENGEPSGVRLSDCSQLSDEDGLCSITLPFGIYRACASGVNGNVDGKVHTHLTFGRALVDTIVLPPRERAESEDSRLIILSWGQSEGQETSYKLQVETPGCLPEESGENKDGAVEWVLVSEECLSRSGLSRVLVQMLKGASFHRANPHVNIVGCGVSIFMHVSDVCDSNIQFWDVCNIDGCSSTSEIKSVMVLSSDPICSGAVSSIRVVSCGHREKPKKGRQVAAGEPIPGAEVRVECATSDDQESISFVGRTGVDGVVSLFLPFGDHKVSVSCSEDAADFHAMGDPCRLVVDPEFPCSATVVMWPVDTEGGNSIAGLSSVKDALLFVSTTGTPATDVVLVSSDSKIRHSQLGREDQWASVEVPEEFKSAYAPAVWTIQGTDATKEWTVELHRGKDESEPLAKALAQVILLGSTGVLKCWNMGIDIANFKESGENSRGTVWQVTKVEFAGSKLNRDWVDDKVSAVAEGKPNGQIVVPEEMDQNKKT